MPVLEPMCKKCGQICNIWIGLDGITRYICPDLHLIENYGVDVSVLCGAQVVSREATYVNHCWNCSSYIDSRLPQLCPRDIAEGYNHLFCCPHCGMSMRQFPGRNNPPAIIPAYAQTPPI